MKSLQWVIAILLATLVSCTYDNEIDLYGTNQCQTANMSYQNDIQPIFSIACAPCHVNGRRDGNIGIGEHSDVMAQITRGRLIGTIQHDSGFSPMPQNRSKLLDCEIEKILSWIADGSPNN